jgi:3-deoxy-D-manno-octulosonic-acid transferase
MFGALAELIVPFFALKEIIKQGRHPLFPERFGEGRWDKINKVDIWLHGASLGEIEGVIPVAKELLKRGYKLHLTSTTLTGQEAIKRAELPCSQSLLPFDHPRSWRRIFKHFRPSLFLNFETELWPNLFNECKQRGIPIVIINGRISDKSFPRYHLLSPLMNEVFKIPKKFIVQTETDKERFLALGVELSKLKVVNSTKYEPLAKATLAEDKLNNFQKAVGYSTNQLIFTGGSVRKEEEEIFLAACKEILKLEPSVRIILAPRHPERFKEISQIIEKYQIPYSRRSEGGKITDNPLLLLDTLGELRFAYACSTIAFVGGSLVNLGGHNPLEPAAFSLPVIMGQYSKNVHDIVLALKFEKGIFEVTDGAHLVSTVLELINNEGLRKSFGQNANKVLLRYGDAVGRSITEIEEFLPR